jgi:hypothetical protein
MIAVVPVLGIIIPLLASAGLECHETDIQKSIAALESVASTECKEPEKIKGAERRLRELGFESSCDPIPLNKAKQIVRDLRIDSWINKDLAACKSKVGEAADHVRELRKSKAPGKRPPAPKGSVKTE